ncbi:hypothetical protein ACPA9J_28020 [Pseudomonas aeruginosa]
MLGSAAYRRNGRAQRRRAIRRWLSWPTWAAPAADEQGGWRCDAGGYRHLVRGRQRPGDRRRRWRESVWPAITPAPTATRCSTAGGHRRCALATRRRRPSARYMLRKIRPGCPQPAPGLGDPGAGPTWDLELFRRERMITSTANYHFRSCSEFWAYCDAAAHNHTTSELPAPAAPCAMANLMTLTNLLQASSCNAQR